MMIIRYRPLLLVLLLTIGLVAAGILRLDIETDIVRSLPAGEKVLADAALIFEHHPIHDQVAIDIALADDNPDLLVDFGTALQGELAASGLFSRVGFADVGEQLQELTLHVVRNLPALFSSADLERHVAPLLTSQQIETRLNRLVTELSTMEGIGQQRFIEADPLGFKDLILAKLALLTPSSKIRFYRGHLLSADSRHLLLTADPLGSGTDSTAARQIADQLDHSVRLLAQRFNLPEHHFIVTPVGAYRAALDNERIIRRDVRLALVLATLGIAALLLFAFPRPLLGLTALLPAFAGSAAALFCYSLLHDTISVMVLGFGGALISITVDHGITYLLFLDRPYQTRGREASHEVFAIGIMAVVTSVGAFLILSLSPFPIFTQLGQFTALGICFSFLFVHLVMPRLFPTMPPGSPRRLPLQSLVGRLSHPSKTLAVSALLVTAGLIFFARPHFAVQLSSMNTVGEKTRAADEVFATVWGDGDDRIFLMHSSASPANLQRENDRLLEQLEQDIEQNVLTSAFVPSLLFPGPRRQADNLAAWHEFWHDERVARLTATLQNAAAARGFADDAFTGFLTAVKEPSVPAAKPVPADYYQLLGIVETPQQEGLIQFITAVPGSIYSAPNFIEGFADAVTIFDGSYFSDRLADVLFSTFVTMLAVIAVSVTVLLALFYLDLSLTVLTLLPVVFAYVCTLATLRFIGRPLDIPALMLAVVVFGMGIDYSIFFVRAHQRYRRSDHPSYVLAGSGVVLAAASTLIGFGALCFADHSLLRSIGITSALGLGYSLVGTFLLLPPLLTSYFDGHTRQSAAPDASPDRRLLARYRTLEAYPRLFARLKLRFDPMFADLPGMLTHRSSIKTIIDIGCGHGIPACWCLERHPGSVVCGIEPDPEKVRIAALAVGERGSISRGWAPELPAVETPADVALLLDMLHYLDDEALHTLSAAIRPKLAAGGIIVARFVTRPPGAVSWAWRLEDIRVRLAGCTPRYHTAAGMATVFTAAGYDLVCCEPAPSDEELIWLVARVSGKRSAAGASPAPS
jgi:predicted exporter